MRRLLALLMILASLVAACTGGGAPTPTQETAGDTGAGTGAVVELPESFSGETASNGTLAFNYPSGWIAAGSADAVTLTSTEAGVGMTVIVVPSAALSPLGDAAAIVSSLAETSISASGGTISEVEEINVGGNEGAVVTVTQEGVKTALLLVNFGAGYVEFSLTAPETRFEVLRPTLDAVAASTTLGS